MRIVSDVTPYVINDSATVAHTLLRIDENKSGTIFVVNEIGKLVGVMTDGDFRRWLSHTHNMDLSQPVTVAMNQDFTSCGVNQSTLEIGLTFTGAFNMMPLLNDAGHIKSVAFNNLNGIEVDGRLITNDHPAYLIAEIGNNHNGSLSHAKELVDAAVSAKADCVKFQMRDMGSVYRYDGKTRDDSADLGAQYVFNLLEKFQLSNEELIEIFDYCKSQDVTPLCTPWDHASLNVLEDYGMPAYKVSSADLTNFPLLKSLAETGKPLFCSTGMSTENEIIQAVKFMNKHGAQFVLLHCNSTYPAPLKDINLKYLSRLQEIGSDLVGYSGHELGVDVSVAAVAMGAKVVEKHFTLDRSMEGNDHKVSLLPGEFAAMVNSIRDVEEAIGNSSARSLSQGEMMNRETLAKSLVAKKAVSKGDIIDRSMIDVRSPGQGLQPHKQDELLGKVAIRDIEMGDFFYQADVDGEVISARNYLFDRPFGIPVRYHDYEKLAILSNLDFVEFHLSFQDLEVDIHSVFSKQQKIGFAIHAPELFANDHIIDLSAKNTEDLEISRTNLQEVVSLTRKLKEYFPTTETPVIVLNAGGFSDRAFIDHQDTPAMYEQVAKELLATEQAGVEIIIQSMPPFPWHFGGQRYHNLFVNPDEISTFCERYQTRICLDISHAMMACNYYGWDLSNYVAKVGKYTAHLHISDALGDSGEGVQMGSGDVNFAQLGQTLKEHVPGVMFIPEIWQGHKNSGEGFWQAFAKLESHMQP